MSPGVCSCIGKNPNTCAVCLRNKNVPNVFIRRRSKGDAKKGTGRKTSENVMTNRFPCPPTPFCQRPPPLPCMSSEVQKRGKLVRELRGPKDKPMGVRGTLCHDIFFPVPLPASPSDLHRLMHVSVLHLAGKFTQRNKSWQTLSHLLGVTAAL